MKVWVEGGCVERGGIGVDEEEDEVMVFDAFETFVVVFMGLIIVSCEGFGSSSTTHSSLRKWLERPTDRTSPGKTMMGRESMPLLYSINGVTLIGILDFTSSG